MTIRPPLPFPERMRGQPDRMTRAPSRSDPTEADKVAFLSRPSAHPHAPETVEVEETHMSWVFLAGPRVLKLKKPVRTEALDFGTLARREAAVRDEIRLNRRLAPDVYLGARALRARPDGTLSVDGGGEGEVVDWLVEMRRLPADATLDARLAACTATPRDVAAVVRLLSGFYRGLPPSGVTAEAHASLLRRQILLTGATLRDPRLDFDGPEVAAALAMLDVSFSEVRPLLDARVEAGRIVEGHGDLRPEHVFLTDPPVVIDCLEFNRALRTVDPFDEIVFLGLECARMGAGWVMQELLSGMSGGLGDRPEPELLAFYWRYRALLRARLALLHLTEPVVRKPRKWRPLALDYVALAGEADFRIRPRRGR